MESSNVSSVQDGTVLPGVRRSTHENAPAETSAGFTKDGNSTLIGEDLPTKKNPNVDSEQGVSQLQSRMSTSGVPAFHFEKPEDTQPLDSRFESTEVKQTNTMFQTSAIPFDTSTIYENIERDRQDLKLTLYDLTERINKAKEKKDSEFKEHISVLDEKGQIMNGLANEMEIINERLENSKLRENFIHSELLTTEARKEQLASKISVNESLKEGIKNQQSRIQSNIANLNTMIEEQSFQLRDTTAQLNMVTREFDLTKRDVQSAASENARLNETEQKANDIILEKLKTESKTIQTDLLMNQKLNDIVLAIQKERKQVDAKRLKVNELKELYKSKKQLINGPMEGSEDDEADSLESENEKLQKEVLNLNGKIEVLNKTLADLKQTTYEVEQDDSPDAFQSEMLKQNEDTLNEQERKIFELKQNVNELTVRQAAVANSRYYVDQNLTSGINSKTIELELRLQDLQNAKQILIKNAKTNVNSYERELVNLEENVNDTEKQVLEIATSLSAAKDELFHNTNELKDKYNEILELNAELHGKYLSTQAKYNEIDNNNKTDLTLIQDNFKREHDLNFEIYNKLMETQKELERNIVKIKGDNEALRDDIEKSKDRLEGIRYEKQTIQSEVASLKELKADQDDQTAYRKENYLTCLNIIKEQGDKITLLIAEEEKAISSLKADLEEAETISTGKTNTVSDLEKKAEKIKAKMFHSASVYRDIMRENERVEENMKKVADSDKHIHELANDDEKLLSLLEHAERIRNKIEHVKELVKKENDILLDNLDKLNEVNSAITTLEGDNATLHTDFENERLRLKEKSNKTSSKIHGLVEQLSSNGQRFASQLSTYKQERDRLQARIDDIKSKMKSEDKVFNAEKSRSDAYIQNLTSRYEALEQTYKELSDAKKHRYEEFNNQQSGQKDKLNAITQECQNMKGQIVETRNNILKLNQDCKSNLVTLNNQILDLKDKINEITNETDKLQAKNNAITPKLQKLQKKMNVYDSNIRHAKLQSMVFEENIKSVNSQLASNLNVEASIINGIPTDSAISTVVLECSQVQSQVQDIQQNVDQIIERIAAKNQELLQWQHKIGLETKKSVRTVSARVSPPRYDMSKKSISPRSITSLSPKSPTVQHLNKAHLTNMTVINQIKKRIETLQTQLGKKQELLDKMKQKREELLDQKEQRLQQEVALNEQLQDEISKLESNMLGTQEAVKTQNEELSQIRNKTQKLLADLEKAQLDLLNAEKLLDERTHANGETHYQEQAVNAKLNASIEKLQTILSSLNNHNGGLENKTYTGALDRAFTQHLALAVTNKYIQNMANLYTNKNKALMGVNDALHNAINSTYSAEENVKPTPLDHKLLNKLTANGTVLIDNIQDVIQKLTDTIRMCSSDSLEHMALMESFNDLCLTLNGVADNILIRQLTDVISDYEARGLPSLDATRLAESMDVPRQASFVGNGLNRAGAPAFAANNDTLVLAESRATMLQQRRVLLDKTEQVAGICNECDSEYAATVQEFLAPLQQAIKGEMSGMDVPSIQEHVVAFANKSLEHVLEVGKIIAPKAPLPKTQSPAAPVRQDVPSGNFFRSHFNSY